MSAGDTLVGSARAWKGAAKGVGLEAQRAAIGSWSESTHPCFDAGDGRSAASGKTTLARSARFGAALQQPASERDRLTDMPLKDSSPLDADQTDARPPPPEKLGGACRFPGKRRREVAPCHDSEAGAERHAASAGAWAGRLDVVTTDV